MNKKTTLLAALVVLFLSIGLNANAIDRHSLVQYAASLKGKEGAELKAALMPLLKPKQVLSYGSRKGHTWEGFYKTDRDPETNECYNRYSSKKFYFPANYDYKAISGMNIEHSFPKSWWGGNENDAYKDLYNLYPSDSKANSSKSNYPMDEVPNGAGEEGYDHVGNGVHTSKAWEPGDQFKGDFARSYMYMAVAYGDLTFAQTGLLTMSNEDYPGLKSWASTLYIKWGKQDSIDAREITRNNAVASIESNRNLLIDFPYLVDYLWGDSTDVAFDPYTSVTTADGDDRYWKGAAPVVPDNPDEPVVDDVYYFTTANGVTSGKQYLIVANDGGTLHAMRPITESKGYGYGYVTNVQEANDTIRLSKLDNAFTLTASGDGFTILDSKSKYLYHKGTYKSFNVSANTTDASIWTITANADGTFKILTDGTYFIQYSTGYKSYGCYDGLQSDGIQPILYERVEKSTPSGIQNINTEKDGDDSVYTIQGQFVGKSLNRLPQGIYIRNGKKYVIR